jgi:O-antigen ligase
MTNATIPASGRLETVERALSAVILAGAMLYIAARYSDKGGLVNVGFYLPITALGVLALLTRGRVIVDLLSSHLGAATAVYVIALGYAIAIAPDPNASWRAFVPAHGRALLTALFVGYAASRAENARYLLIALVAGALISSMRQIVAHAVFWTEMGAWQIPYDWVREFGEAHGFFLPAVIAMALLAKGRWRIASLATVAAVEGLLLLVTGLRGAWLGVAAAAILAGAMSRRWMLLAAALGIACAGVALLVFMAPEGVVAQRLARGFDTSLRTTGTWGPALDLIGERPLKGYGYGLAVFHEAFNAEVPRHPEWAWKTSLGPHSIFLGAWFAGGPVLLAAMLWLFASMARAYVGNFRSASEPPVRALALSALAAFTSFYLVHGLLEDKLWLAFGILLGFALGLDRIGRRPRLA